MITQPTATGQQTSTFIVTGASSGIGRELAQQLAARGHAVIAIARDGQRLAETAKASPRITAIPFDLRKIETIDAFAAALLADHPRITGIINNAAIQHDKRVDDASYTAAQIDEEIAINLTAPIALTRALLPHLKTQPHAVIVNLGSGLGFVPKRTSAVYSATKAGLRLFSDALRVQLQGSGVQIIEAIMPLVDTPMTAGRGGEKMPAAAAATAILDGLDSGAPQIFIGKARALRMILRFAPSVAARMMQR
jgi:short-subunit dehydrogenase involved in D-alanine esterification of teichoic acids